MPEAACWGKLAESQLQRVGKREVTGLALLVFPEVCGLMGPMKALSLLKASWTSLMHPIPPFPHSPLNQPPAREKVSPDIRTSWGFLGSQWRGLPLPGMYQLWKPRQPCWWGGLQHPPCWHGVLLTCHPRALPSQVRSHNRVKPSERQKADFKERLFVNKDSSGLRRNTG